MVRPRSKDPRAGLGLRNAKKAPGAYRRPLKHPPVAMRFATGWNSLRAQLVRTRELV